MSNSNNTPLYTALMEYSMKKKPFHMPGHKLGSFGDMKQIDFTALDVTEANGLDNLYEAEGIIKEAMDKMCTYYGAQKTIFLTNGSTSGILTSLMVLCKPGDEVLIARNCHHSVWHALVLSGAIPIYIQPEYDESLGLMTVMSKEVIQEALQLYPKVKGAIIVSPTYEGIVSDIKDIAKVLHEAGKALIVDEAHGAHFGVSVDFPISSVKLGADLVIQSMHKTMPTLTQSALLHQGTDQFSYEHLVKTLRMVQTSSPSYAMMAMMDYARGYIEEHQDEIVKQYIEPLKEMRSRLVALQQLYVLDIPRDQYDMSKIIVFTHHTSIDGYTLGQYLEERYNIVVEASLSNYVILMTTVADQVKSLSELEKALIDIDDELTLKQNTNTADLYCSELTQVISELPKVQKGGYTPREVYYGDYKWCEIDHCLGKVTAETIMFYPPGIPILYMGEIFNEKHIQLIRTYAERLKGIQYKGNKINCKVLDIPLK